MNLRLLFLVAACFSSAAGQAASATNDDDLKAADEALKIADAVSQDTDNPPEDAVSMPSDSELQGADSVQNEPASEPHAKEELGPPPAAGPEEDVGTEGQESNMAALQLPHLPKKVSSPSRTKKLALEQKTRKKSKRIKHSRKHKKHHSSKKAGHFKRGAKSKKQSPDLGNTEQAAIDASNAHKAAETAKVAAKVATKVAEHSVHLTEHAKSALKDAKDALHKARVDTKGLSVDQKESLKSAEAKLKEATKDTEYGAVADAEYAKSKGVDIGKFQNEERAKYLGSLKDKLDNTLNGAKKGSELEQMREELEQMREQLAKKTGRKMGDAKELLPEENALKELQEMIKQLEAAEASGKVTPTESHDELKVEIEKLKDAISRMEGPDNAPVYEVPAKPPVKKETGAIMEPLPPTGGEEPVPAAPVAPTYPVEKEAVTPVGRIDVDTAMPYGDLEPFGREDTAQELTEASIRESDEMVDQLERAEVAEEKRAVFRALTRLRGAAITSFDGVARSQTGNIDEYNKVHKWRNTHPLHHLADEESDISKWAFPDNADF